MHEADTGNTQNMQKPSYVALYRRFRPEFFYDVVGQNHVTRTLQNALAHNRVSHAYLFCGLRGTGKTTMAKLLAKALNCIEGIDHEPCGTCRACREVAEGRNLDVLEIDAASNRGIDEIRELREKVRYAAAENRYKVYIIDEVHMLTNEAFNALLKTLEEPPPKVVFILATTEAHKVPLTIISRCQRFDFHLLETAQVAEHLRKVSEEMGFSVDEETLYLLARQAEGSVRDALGLLEQCRAYGGDSITHADALEILGLASPEVIYELIQAVIEENIAAGLKSIGEVVYRGRDLHRFLRELTLYLRKLLLLVSGTPEEEALDDVPALSSYLKEHKDKFNGAVILEMLEIMHELNYQLKSSSQPQFLLELTFLRLVRAYRFRDYLSPGELLSRLEEMEEKLTSASAQGFIPKYPENTPAESSSELSEKASEKAPVESSGKASDNAPEKSREETAASISSDPASAGVDTTGTTEPEKRKTAANKPGTAPGSASAQKTGSASESASGQKPGSSNGSALEIEADYGSAPVPEQADGPQANGPVTEQADGSLSELGSGLEHGSISEPGSDIEHGSTSEPVLDPSSISSSEADFAPNSDSAPASDSAAGSEPRSGSDSASEFQELTFTSEELHSFWFEQLLPALMEDGKYIIHSYITKGYPSTLKSGILTLVMPDVYRKSTESNKKYLKELLCRLLGREVSIRTVYEPGSDLSGNNYPTGNTQAKDIQSLPGVSKKSAGATDVDVATDKEDTVDPGKPNNNPPTSKKNKQSSQRKKPQNDYFVEQVQKMFNGWMMDIKENDSFNPRGFKE